MILKKYKSFSLLLLLLISLAYFVGSIDMRTNLTSEALVEKGAVGVFSFTKASAGSSEMIPIIPQKMASTELWFPEVYKKYYGYESGVSIVNTTSQKGTLDFYFYNANGQIVASYKRSIVPNGLLVYYIPNEFPSLLSGVYSLKVTSNVNIVGSLNSITAGSFETIGYRGFPKNLASKKLWIQKAWKRVPGSGTKWSSGLGVSNTLNESLSFTISFINRYGGLAGKKDITLPPFGRAGFYIPNLQLNGGSSLPEGFYGAAVIEADKTGLIGIYNVVGESGANMDSATYEMISEWEIGNNLFYPYIPALFEDKGEIAGFTYQNASWTTIPAPNVKFFNSGGAVRELMGSPLSPQEAVYNGDLVSFGLSRGYYSIIVSNPGYNMAGLFNPTDNISENTSFSKKYVAASQALSDYHTDTILFVTQIPASSYGWTSKVTIQNVGSKEIIAQISYKNQKGENVGQLTKSIKQGAAYTDTPSLQTNGYALINIF